VGIRAVTVKLNRRLGLWLERTFWRRCLATAGRGHEAWYELALAPGKELSSFHRRFIDDLPEPRVRVLEVGSGPMTVLGARHPSKEITIVATDVLAEPYARMLARKGIVAPIPTIWADAEHLVDRFGVKSFDYVTANNCIDHCEDPVRAIQQMLAVVKPGHAISLRHRENEGEQQRYVGLHKWNFGLQDGAPVLFDRRHRFDLRELTRPWGTLTTFPEPGHVVFAVRRQAEREPV
jgi:SAM-dependent methyltransferase